MMREATRRAALGALCACAVLVVGCTSVPRATNELEAARAVYRTAAANPQVQARAPVELELAERELRDAENLQSADAEPARVAHFSYLAAQRSRIAMKTAELRAAEAEYAMANEQRNRMQLELGQRGGAQPPASSGQTAR
jgi:predicted component of type VI protein secretion system